MATISKVLSGSTASTLTSDIVQVLKVRWVGAVGAGDTVTLTDLNSNIVWSAKSAAANYTEIDTFAVGRNNDFQVYRWNGVKISQITSGTIYVYIA